MNDKLPEGVKIVGCRYCDFGRGTRGMDSCGPCGGSGQRFQIRKNGTLMEFPNTKAGYEEACAELGVTPV